MELIFETKTADYLREVFSSVIAQEESGESIVPDSHPDVGQILQTFGTVVLRGKECRNGSIHLSGGVLLAVDGGGSGRLGDDIGSPDDGDDRDHQKHHADGAVQEIGAARLFALLGLLGGLGIGPAGAHLLLPGLLFS